MGANNIMAELPDLARTWSDRVRFRGKPPIDNYGLKSVA